MGPGKFICLEEEEKKVTQHIKFFSPNSPKMHRITGKSRKQVQQKTVMENVNYFHFVHSFSGTYHSAVITRPK